MIAAIASFEIRKRLAQISTYVYFGLFFALAFLLTIRLAEPSEVQT